MSYCACEHPRENDRRPGYCRRCGVRFNPKWLSSDENLTAFLTRVAQLPEITPAAILHAQRRERAGRKAFGLSYIGRDNDAEGQEEAADGLIYAALSWLNDCRNGTEEIDPDLLDAAHHFAMAHAALERRRK